MNPQAKDNAIWAGVAALLMLYFGWGSGLVGISDDAFYNATVAVFVWMLRIGGICMLVVTGVCLLGLRVGLLLDAGVSGLCGLVLVLCGGYWTLHDGFGLQDVLYIVFGFMFLGTARSHWVAFTQSGSDAPREGPSRRGLFGIKPLAPPEPPTKPEPPHPASIRPKSLPESGEPPPDGYLAAMAHEDEEPPTASFK